MMETDGDQTLDRDGEILQKRGRKDWKSQRSSGKEGSPKLYFLLSSKDFSIDDYRELPGIHCTKKTYT